MNDITIIIKTIERPQCLDRLIKSIRGFYPDIKIIVADDGKNPTKREDVYKYLILPYDTGSSEGRNIMVENVDTEYVFLADDDFIFTIDTDLELLKNVFENSEVDLLGINVKNHYNMVKLLREGQHLFCFRGVCIEERDSYFLCDITPNCFLARTETLKEHKWPKEAKTDEHYLYFYMIWKKLRVGLAKGISVGHQRIFETPEYELLRSGKRIMGTLGELWRKEGIRFVITFERGLGKATVENWNDTTMKFMRAAQEREEKKCL